MLKLKRNALGLYQKKLSLIPQDEIEGFFHQSRKWNLAPALSDGGSVIFPHTLLRTCGDQVAAAVLGCLDSGAQRVIALGVLHPLERQFMIDARQKSYRGEDISGEPSWGIFGPLFPESSIWKIEYSLQNFEFLWNYEIQKRKIKNPPELILAYPCLANREPWKLPSMDQLKSYLPNSLIVLTCDFCHLGKAYETPEERHLPISMQAEEFARKTIEQGLHIFAEPDYGRYIDFCAATISDGVDTGQVLMYLKGPLKSKILDLRLIDTAHLFENDPSPSWVAASLIEMTR